MRHTNASYKVIDIKPGTDMVPFPPGEDPAYLTFPSGDDPAYLTMLEGTLNDYAAEGWVITDIKWYDHVIFEHARAL